MNALTVFQTRVACGSAILMKETSPFSIYVHSYACRLNLAWEASSPLVPNLKNALVTSQSLYNFIGESAKRAVFSNRSYKKIIVSIAKIAQQN